MDSIILLENIKQRNHVIQYYWPISQQISSTKREAWKEIGNLDHIEAPVVMIFWNDLDDKTWEEKTNKYNLQGKSEISKHWFYIDHEWFKENSSTCGPEFYKKRYQMNIEGQEMETYQYL